MIRCTRECSHLRRQKGMPKMPSGRQDIGAQTLAALLRVPEGTEIAKCKNPLSVSLRSTHRTPSIARLTYLIVLPLLMLSSSL